MACHFTSQYGSGTFEVEPFPQHEAPAAKRAFHTDPRQKHNRRFVKQRAQPAITGDAD